jgi:hypothetical protein
VNASANLTKRIDIERDDLSTRIGTSQRAFCFSAGFAVAELRRDDRAVA